MHWSGSKEVINELIQNNCDINAVNFNGRTALHIMVMILIHSSSSEQNYITIKRTIPLADDNSTYHNQ